jgi:hypothetical protein
MSDRINLPRADQLDSIDRRLEMISFIISEGGKPSDWAGIAGAVRVGLGAAYYPVGTQFEVSHSEYGTLIFEVVAHNYLASNSMMLQCKTPLPAMQYDAPEAMLRLESPLAIGTYYFNVPTGTPNWPAGNYCFGVDREIPAGSVICIADDLDTPLVQSLIICYADEYGTVLNTSGISYDNVGTSLGTLGVELNDMRRIGLGSNNWSESALRQWLNSDSDAGAVWSPKTKFDRPPTWHSDKAGFLRGLPGDFLSVLGEVDVPCASNRVYESPDSLTVKSSRYTTRDIFFLPSCAEITGEQSGVDDASEQLERYIPEDELGRIAYRDGVAVSYWLRTPHPDVSYAARRIENNGAVTDSQARAERYITPLCCIK